jgi:hypothetical protein
LQLQPARKAELQEPTAVNSMGQICGDFRQETREEAIIRTLSIWGSQLTPCRARWRCGGTYATTDNRGRGRRPMNNGCVAGVGAALEYPKAPERPAATGNLPAATG